MAGTVRRTYRPYPIEARKPLRGKYIHPKFYFSTITHRVVYRHIYVDADDRACVAYISDHYREFPHREDEGLFHLRAEFATPAEVGMFDSSMIENRCGWWDWG